MAPRSQSSRAARFLARTLSAFALASCFDAASGPRGQPHGVLHFSPSYELRSAPDLVPFTRVRVRLFRLGAEGVTARDTTIEYPVGAESLTVNLDVPLQTLTGSESFNLQMAMINAAGDTVFRAGGPVTVVAATGGGTPSTPIQLPTRYVGPGSNAASVRFGVRDTAVKMNDTVNVPASAFDASGGALANTPIEFSSPDTALILVPDERFPAFVGKRARGVARIVARTLTGQADTALVTVRPFAAALAVHAGNGQTAPAATTLATPLSARVLAPDSLPLAGVVVRFTVSEPSTTGGSVGSVESTTNADGIASTTWTLGTRAGAASVAATVVGTALPAATFSATVAHGPPAKLRFRTAPVTVTAGTTFPAPIAVEALDSFDNLATSFTGEIALLPKPGTGVDEDGNPIPSEPGEAQPKAIAAGGVATFASSLSFVEVIRGIAVQATSGALTAAVSDTFSIVPAPAHHLRVSVSPPATITAGVAIEPAVHVRVEDAFGNRAVYADSVFLTLTGGTSGAVLAGVMRLSASGGQVSFPGLSVNRAGSGYGLTASALTALSLASGASTSFSVAAGSATSLAVVVAPTSAMSGALLSPQPSVQLRDAHGNDAAQAGVTVTASLVGAGTLGGTHAAATDVSGRATYSNLSISGTAGGDPRTLSFGASLGGATVSGSSGPITLAVGEVSASASTATVPESAPAGVPVSITVQARDAAGNARTASSGTVSGSIAGANAGILGVTDNANGTYTLTYTPANAGSDQLTILLDVDGTGSVAPAPISGSPFALTITGSGPPVTPVASLTFASQPSSVTAGAPLNSSGLVVHVKDASGAIITTYSDSVWLAVEEVAEGGGGALRDFGMSEPPVLVGLHRVRAVEGMATFPADLTVHRSGAYLLRVSVPGSLVTGTSSDFDISAGPLHHFIFIQQPQSAPPGEPMTGNVIVGSVDQYDNLVPFPSTSVNLSVHHPSFTGIEFSYSGPIISGSAADYSNVTVFGPEGTGYTLLFQTELAPGIPPVSSAPFNLGAAGTVAVVEMQTPIVQYRNIGETFTDVEVKLLDAFGNPVAGVTVYFADLFESSTFSPSEVVSDADGLARSSWTGETTTPGTRLAMAHLGDFGSGCEGTCPEAFTIFAAVVRPAGVTHVWKGNILESPEDGLWEDPSNWLEGTVPTASSHAYLPGFLSNVTTSDGIVVGSLRLDPGAVLRLAENSLTVHGSLTGDGSVTEADQVVLQGSGGVDQLGAFIETGSVTVAGDYQLDMSQSLASLTVTGHLDFTSHSISLTGDFTANAGGRITMANFNSFTVDGNALFGGGVSNLTSGYLQLTGNLTQAGDAASFNAGPDFVTVLMSEGTTPQTISLGNPSASQLGPLQVFGAGGLNFLTNATINGRLDIDGLGDITGPEITLLGNMCQSVTGTKWKVNITRMAGPDHAVVATDCGPDGEMGLQTMLEVSGSREFGLVTLTGDVLVHGAGAFGVGYPVTINGSFSTTEGGRLQMFGESLTVTGDVSFGSTGAGGTLSGGTLIVQGGTFTQSGHPLSFVAGSGHTTVFTNPAVSINFANMFEAESRFGNVIFDAPSMATFNLPSTFVAMNDVTVEDGSTLQFPGGFGPRLHVGRDLIYPGTGGTLSVNTLSLGRQLLLNSATVYTVVTTKLTGTGQLLTALPSGVSYENVTVSGTALVDTHVNVEGELLLAGTTPGTGVLTVTGNLNSGDPDDGSGILRVGDSELGQYGRLIVGYHVTAWGDFRTGAQGVVEMIDDTYELFVDGDAEFGGASTAGLMTMGQLMVGGSFTQLSTTSAQSFAPSGTHRTDLMGLVAAQNVQFASPARSGGSAFNILRLQNEDTDQEVVLLSGIAVNKELRMERTTGADIYIRSEGGTFEINTEGVFVADGGVDVELSNTSLRIDGSSAMTDIRNINWSGMPTDAVQLYVRTGETLSGIVLDNLQFQLLTSGDTGKYYIWEQTAGSVSGDFLNVSPEGHEFFDEFGAGLIELTWTPGGI